MLKNTEPTPQPHNKSLNVWNSTPLNLSYVDHHKLPMSPAYRAAVVASGGGATVYEYIRDHLGYRLEVHGTPTASVVGRTLTVNATISNFGFAAPVHPRPVLITLQGAQQLARQPRPRPRRPLACLPRARKGRRRRRARRRRDRRRARPGGAAPPPQPEHPEHDEPGVLFGDEGRVRVRVRGDGAGGVRVQTGVTYSTRRICTLGALGTLGRWCAVRKYHHRKFGAPFPQQFLMNQQSEIFVSPIVK